MEESLKAGLGAFVITPPAGVRMAGYALRTKGAEGVHDDIMVEALWLEDANRAVLVIAADVLGINEELAERLKREISEELGVPAEHIIACATHNHSGPDLLGGYSEDYARLQEDFIARAETAALMAERSKKEVIELRGAIGRVEEVIVNRRNPRGGPLDPRLHLISMVTRGGEILVVNYACHAAVLGPRNLMISADYPGALRRRLEALTGARVLFLNGTCGDVNPLTPGTKLEDVYNRNVGRFEDVEWMGSILALEAAKRRLLAERRRQLKLGFARAICELRLKHVPKRDEAEAALEEAERAMKAALESGDRKQLAEAAYQMFKARRLLRLSERLAGRTTLRAPISALALSEKDAIVFLPSEVFVKLGMEIKARSPFENTMVVAYADDYFGYIPTREAFAEGGYEVDYPVSIIAPGEGERLAEEAVKLLRRLHEEEAA